MNCGELGVAIERLTKIFAGVCNKNVLLHLPVQGVTGF
jgi:hypothetical protein